MFKIVRSKIYNRLKHLAYHDNLTGLLNRHWLFNNMHLITQKYVYFIDINDLYIVNKKGHAFGDECIKSVVHNIPQFRSEYLIRYGGDEFLLFSNYVDIVTTNEDISVGCAKIGLNINSAIEIANMKMLANKRKRG